MMQQLGFGFDDGVPVVASPLGANTRPARKTAQKLNRPSAPKTAITSAAALFAAPVELPLPMWPIEIPPPPSPPETVSSSMLLRVRMIKILV